jgi:hypothetical protein
LIARPYGNVHPAHRPTASAAAGFTIFDESESRSDLRTLKVPSAPIHVSTTLVGARIKIAISHAAR